MFNLHASRRRENEALRANQREIDDFMREDPEHRDALLRAAHGTDR